jgi:hypothetical protein
MRSGGARGTHAASDGIFDRRARTRHVIVNEVYTQLYP